MSTQAALEAIPLVATGRRKPTRTAPPQRQVALIVATLVGSPRIARPLGRGPSGAAFLGVASWAGTTTAAVKESDIVAARRRPTRAAPRVADAALGVQKGLGDASRVETVAPKCVGNDASEVETTRLAVTAASSFLRPLIPRKPLGPLVSLMGRLRTAQVTSPCRALASGGLVRLGAAHLLLTTVFLFPGLFGVTAVPVRRDFGSMVILWLSLVIKSGLLFCWLISSFLTPCEVALALTHAVALWPPRQRQRLAVQLGTATPDTEVLPG